MRHSPLTAAAAAGAGVEVEVEPATTFGPAGPPALVAVAHGSRDPRAAATVEGLLAAVRARRPGLRVVTSYLDHAPPTPVQALGALAASGGEAVVLPLLLTAAYHTKTDIPRALAEVRRRHPRLALRYGDPLGPHQLLIDALERRLAEAGTPAGDPDTAVVLVAAGSTDPAAGGTIARLARRWRRRGWRDVAPAYASAAPPTPAEAVRALREAGAPRVAVASYFLAPGYFADKVRAESLRAGADVVSPVLGAAPELAGLVLRRYDEALVDLRPAAVG
jgi:sirohydrochlorin ferrochelatase